MPLFDGLPYLLAQSKKIHGEFSLFVGLKDVQLVEELPGSFKGIAYRNGKSTLQGIPFAVDYWESAPLLEQFDGELVVPPPTFSAVLSDLVDSKPADIQIQQKGDQMLFSFQICDSRQTEAATLCLVLKEILRFLGKDSALSIENVLFPMASAGAFEILVHNSEDRTDMVMYNSFGGECGRLEGISSARGETLPLVGSPKRLAGSLSSSTSSSMSDEVFLPADPFPEIATIIRSCLVAMHFNTDTLYPEESFVSFGLDSLDCVELEQRISQKVGKQLPVGIVDKDSSLANLSASLFSYMGGEEEGQEVKEIPIPRARPSRWQRRIILADSLEPQLKVQFNEALSFRLLNEELYHRLKTALLIFIVSNPNLRATYNYEEKTFLSGTESYILPSHLPADCFLRVGLDIRSALPLAWNVSREGVVSINFHHVAVDGHSLQLLMKQFKTLLARGDVPIDRVPFKLMKEDHQKIVPLPTENGQRLPTDFPASQAKKRTARIFKKALPSGFARFLRRLRTNCQITDFEFLFSACSLAMKRRTGLSEFSLGIAVSVREEKDKETVDCLVSVVPVPVLVSEEVTVKSFLETVAGRLKKGKEKARTGETGPIQILLVMDKVDAIEIAGLEILETAPTVCKYEQTWYFRKNGAEYHIVVEYCTEIFLEETVQSVVEDLLLAVKRMSEADERTRLTDLSLLRRSPSHKKMDRVDHPKNSMGQMITAANYALFKWAFGSAALSQEDLLLTVATTAYQWEQDYLQHYGEAPTADRQVVIYLPRGLHLGVTSLAAWRLGMSIVPISRDWPTKRIRQMVERFHNPYVVADDLELISQIHGDGFSCALHQKEIIGKKRHRIWSRMSAEALGYITCTSGSTGTPKAVCSSIRGLSNLAMNYVRKFSLNHRSRIYQVGTLCSIIVSHQVVNYAFDIFFADLCKSLATGASMTFAEESLPNWNELESCTNGYIMPAILSSLPASMTGKLRSLETLQFGGERIQPAALDKLLDTGVHLFQEFGLTEQCVYSTALRLKRGTDSSFLGRPYSNIQLVVRDTNGHLLTSCGACGELYLKGFIARGYHGLEERNKERFKGGEFATRDQVVFHSRGLKFVGRMDLQVKILGRRIELGEIEAVLCRVPSVEGVVVTVVEDRLYAHVRGNVDVSKLKGYVAETLPSYMAPEDIFLVKKFPLNANGKVDKAKFVIPKKRDNVAQKRHPEKEEESTICLAMEKILQAPIAVDECFFAKGGNSVKAMLVIQLLKEKGLRIGIKEFFETRTAEKIARKMRNEEGQEIKATDISVLEEKTKLIALSHVQRRLWFIQKLQPESDAYTLKLTIGLDEEVDRRRLEQAVAAIFNHNPALRAEIIEVDGMPYMKIDPEEKTSSSTLIRTTFENERLILEANHLVIDGRSLAILAQQLEKVYQGEFETSRRDPITTREDETDMGFWQVYLEDVEIHNFSPRHSPTREALHRAGRVITSLPKSFTEGVQKEKLFITLLHSIVNTMKKIFDEDDIVLGTTVANRTVEDYDQVGMFANTLPMRFRGEITREMVEEQVHLVLEHQNASLEKIQKLVGGEELVKCVVNYQNTSLSTFGRPFKACHLEPSEYCQFPLSWIFSDEAEDKIQLTLEYDRSVFADLDASRFVDWFLKECGTKREQRLPREHKVDWPKTSIGQILLEQAALSKNNSAVESSKLRTSYQEATLKSLWIAAMIEQKVLALSGQIPRVDDIVTIHLEEGLLLHLAINAVLLVGGAYTVIPISAPEERKQTILKEARNVIGEEDLKDLEKTTRRRAYSRSLPGDLMYVMFTSGSTGSPKGVPVAHRGVTNMLCHATRLYFLHSRARILQFTKSHFDASISNTFGPLVTGGTLCLLDQEKEATEAVAELLPLSLLHMTPAVLDFLVASDEDILRGVESFSIGGEPPSMATIQRVLLAGHRLVQLYGPTEATCYQSSTVLRVADVVNCVGEAVPNLPYGICSWIHPVAMREDVGQFFCGGCQLSRGYLNDKVKTAKAFVPNFHRSKEDQILGRNSRLYLTGDRVHINKQGRLHFLGRKDQQVKISGHRVEIGEVEAALGRLQGVHSTAVVVHEDQAGRNHLLAYYTGSPADYAPLLAERLPSYMIPIKIIPLEKMPMTANGKTDKRALSQQRIEHFCTQEEEEEMSALEQEVLEIYKTVLEVKDLNMESNFFHHGGHSLLVVKLANRLEKQFQVTVPLATVLKKNTPRRMARFVEGGVPIYRRCQEGLEYGPSLLQLPLLRLFRHSSFQEMYTNRVRIRLLHKISYDDIREVFKKLLRRHTSLRTRYHRIGKKITAELVSKEEEFDQIFERSEPDVFKGLPICVRIQQREVVLKTSHAAVDGHSMQILVEEIKQLLDGRDLGGEDKAQEFNLYIEGLFNQHRDCALAYWKQKLDGWKPNTLVTDYPRKTPQNYESHTVVRRIRDLPSSLKSLASKHGVTSFSILLAAIGEAVRTILKVPKGPLAIAAPMNMRTAQFYQTVTMGVNTALILLGNSEATELEEVGQEVMESLGHPLLLDELSQLTGGDKKLYEMMLTFDDYTTYRNEYFKVVSEPEKYSKCELSFFAGPSSEDIIVDYVRDLFKKETIEGILDKLEETLTRWAAERTSPDGFPLTMPQKQMFLASCTGQQRVLPFILKKPIDLDIDHLQRVLHLLVQKHQALRSVFFLSDTGEPLQRVLSMTESYRLIREAKYHKDRAPSTIKMEQNVLKVILDGDLVVLWLHHMVTDAWSTRILEKEIDCLMQEKRTEVETLKYSIRDCLTSSETPPAVDYVQSLLAGKTLFRRKNESQTVWKKIFFVSKFTENAFIQMVSALATSLNVKDSINIGFPFANRTPKNSKLIGYFLNNLVINVSNGESSTISSKKTEVMAWNVPYLELLSAVRQAGKKEDTLFQIYLNCRYDLEASIDDEDLIDLLPLSCEFPVEIDVDSFVSQDKITIRGLASYLTEEELEELCEKIEKRLTEDGKEGLLDTVLSIAAKLLKKNVKKEENFFSAGGTSLQAIELAEELEDVLGREVDMKIIYEAKSFSELARRIEGREAEEAPQPVAPIPSVSPIIVGKKTDVPSATIHRLFEYLSTSNRALFILPNGEKMSSSSVIASAQERAFSLSQEYLQLCGRSLRSDDIVPICGRKSTETWINCFAVQLTGAAYLPISSDSSLSKIKEIVAQAHAFVYIGDDVGLSLPSLQISMGKKKRTTTGSQGIDLAYVISTSGTTGAPKAVCIQHRSLINTVFASIQDLCLFPRDVIYQFTSFCYDNSVLEVFSALASSCRLFLDTSPFTPRRLAKQIRPHKITHCLLFPGLVAQFKDEAFKELRELKYWVTGAEKLWDGLLSRATETGINVIQNYGPTETTCYALTRHMRPGDEATNLGRPIPNTRVKIHDGELWVSGRGRMRGYLNRKDSFEVEGKERWYKTGDLTSQTDTSVLFLGRKDNQVKIRGHRVELDEIEEKLQQMEGMEQCRIRWRDPLLVAYCVALKLSEDEIRRHSEQHLPLHMRPNEIHLLEAMPLTENSKVDFNSLEQPAIQAGKGLIVEICEKIMRRAVDSNNSLSEHGGATLTAVKIKREVEKITKQTVDVEKLLASSLGDVELMQVKPSRIKKAWQLVLGHDNFNENSHFFLCGGTSLHILRLKVELAKLGLDVPVQDLLSHLTHKEMEKLDVPRVIVSLSKANRAEKTVVLLHPLYGGAASYVHLIPLLTEESTQILAIEHPNTFAFSTESPTFFESLGSLTSEYARQLEEHLIGDVILCGISIGGTLAVEVARRLSTRPQAVIVVDTLASPDLTNYSFPEHKEQLLKDCAFASDAVVANSWDLLQMLKEHTWIEADFPLTLLSVDGTDLGWKRFCRQLTVLPVEGPHSSLLRPPVVSRLAEAVRSFY